MNVGGNAERDSLARPLSAPASADLVARTFVLKLLRDRLAVTARERLDFAPSTPGGRVLAGEELVRDLAFRAGQNSSRDHEAMWLRSTIRALEQGQTVAALRELRDAMPSLTEATSVVSAFAGEGG